MCVFIGVQVRFVKTGYIFRVELPSHLHNLSVVSGGLNSTSTCSLGKWTVVNCFV